MTLRRVVLDACGIAVVALASLVAGCNAGGTCRCSGEVPEGTLAVACGETQCVGGALYRCTGANTAAREADSCTPTPTGNPRPAGTPDFVVVGVSGHCISSPFYVCPRSYNHEYFSEEGTVNAIAQPIRDRGFSVETLIATDNLYDQPLGSASPEAIGFLTLLSRLEYVRDAYVGSWDNPTRIIVVAHSHGTVWAHFALHVLEQERAPLPVDVLVDIDAISLGWEDKAVWGTGIGDAWGWQIDDYTASSGRVWPLPISRASDAFNVGGTTTLYDIEDIVPNSAAINLEVWSSDGLGLRDSDHNIRIDGSATDILGFLSMENHEDSNNAGTDSMRWVVSEVMAAYGW